MSRDTSALRYGTSAGRGALTAIVLASGLAFLDTTVVNIALPAIGRQFDVGFSAMQWTVNAYLLTFGSLLLLGGGLGDRFGRRRIFLLGLASFSLFSVCCGLAPNILALIAMRAAQGAAAAVLIPGSFAMIATIFHGEDRSRAVATWSALVGTAAAAGPFIGGWLIDVASWRLVFLINVPITITSFCLAYRYFPDRPVETSGTGLDVRGAATVTIGLTGIVYAIIEGPIRGWRHPGIVVAGATGVASLLLFFRIEQVVPHPMMPLRLFHNQEFSAANLLTLGVYAGYNAALFITVLQLQISLGYSALAAGAALIPIELLLLILSPWVGRTAYRIGYWRLLTIGPLLCAGGFLLLADVSSGTSYISGVLPGVLLFSLGFALTVAPLSTTVLGSVAPRYVGVGSGVNNATARVGGLLAIALLPAVAGASAFTTLNEDRFTHVFQSTMWQAAGLCAIGGLIGLYVVLASRRSPHPPIT